MQQFSFIAYGNNGEEIFRGTIMASTDSDAYNTLACMGLNIKILS